MLNNKDVIVISILSLLCLCMQTQAINHTLEIPTGKTNIIISSENNLYYGANKDENKNYTTLSASFMETKKEDLAKTTISLKANNRIDAKNLYPKEKVSTPALMINADTNNFTLKKIYIDGTIDGRSMSQTDENGLEIVGFDGTKS